MINISHQLILSRNQILGTSIHFACSSLHRFSNNNRPHPTRMSTPSPKQAIDLLQAVQSLKVCEFQTLFHYPIDHNRSIHLKLLTTLFLSPWHTQTTKRTGWVKREVQAPESIADHMYRMSIMSLLAQGTQYDYIKCIKLAIIHDIAECIVGDITPTCGVSDEDKFNLESQGITKLKEMIGSNTLAGDDIESLWNEYERGKTPEASLVKDFDKLEMILQAHEYETAQGMKLQEFFDSTDGKWRTEMGKMWAEEIYKRRREQAIEQK